MRFGELLDALHIGRRKDPKVGDKFDDYHVHAPPRRVATTSSRADRRHDNTLFTSHRRLVLSPSGRSLRAGTRSNHERSERTLSYTRVGAPSWKRTTSAPRALSEVRSATEGNVLNNSTRRRFYAPNERPQPRNRPVIDLPDTFDAASYDEIHPNPDNRATRERNPVRQHTEPIIPFDPYDTGAAAPQPSAPPHAAAKPMPRTSSKKSKRRRPAPPNANVNSASSATVEQAQIGREILPFQPPISRESDVDSEIALPVGPAVHVQRSYVTHALSPADDYLNPSRQPSIELAPTSISTASDVSAQPIKRKKPKKKRPPPLITTGAPHGFAAAGLREPLAGINADPDDAIRGPGFHGLPRPMSAPDTARAASPPRAMPRRNSSKKKKKQRPPPLITPGAPHGFASGGLRDPQIPLPNPALPRPASAPDAHSPYLLSPRVPGNNNGSGTRISPSASAISRVASIPRKNSSKKGRKSIPRPPPLVTHGSPHGFPAGGFREPTKIIPLNHQDSPIIVLSSPSNANSSSSASNAILSANTPPPAEARQRKGSRGRSGLNNGTNNHNTNPHIHTQVNNGNGSSASLIVNRVRARSRIVSSQTQQASNNSDSINAHETRNSSPAAMMAKSNSRARISYSSKQSVRKDKYNNNYKNTSSPTQQKRGPLTDRSSPPKALPMRPAQLESDLLFEEATSISSFGESETNRTRDIFGGNNMMNDSGEVCEEDVFVIGADGVFKGGGFEISKNGMLKSPGNLTRKLSDGKLVDGVPRSSKHLIIVRSLAEFSRGSTLSSTSSRRRSTNYNNVDSTIGAGAAGRVSLAVHRPSGRKIAVKRINVFDVQKRTQLLKELETLMCYDSRFLVRSYGAFYDGEGVVHVTLEYMDRGALSDAIELKGAISEDITVHITEHCLKGLEFLHKNHVLHRDFKTSNILLSRRVCRAKLSDFGLARELQEGESKINSFVGTLAYMSPERLNGNEYTYASDVWGLGICVLECLLGHYPFPRPQSYFDYLEAAQSDPATLLKKNSEVSDHCVDFIKLCTNADPKNRPTVKQLLDHPWITQRYSRDNTNTFRAWLENIPLAHGGLEQNSNRNNMGYSKATHRNTRSMKGGNTTGKSNRRKEDNNNNSNGAYPTPINNNSNMRTEGLRKAKERAHDLDSHERIRIDTRT